MVFPASSGVCGGPLSKSFLKSFKVFALSIRSLAVLTLSYPSKILSDVVMKTPLI
ncbi:Uncharacterised protein [Acinetobacter nosocomialis]|nr:Uncharacterised protein [Acinetobacter nosocomialis]SSQ75561.1 Uncharacterised protein [Acinetobacter nosocomialis]